MPYTEHPHCKTPDDANLTIWRYMDFTKFVAMLENQALYFSNISALSDKFEGCLTLPTVDLFRSIPTGLEPAEAERRREVGEHNLRFMKWGKSLLYVSSWHINDHESAAMWELYRRTGDGIAIQSTMGRLIEAFKNTAEQVHIGMVNYVDYEKDKIDWKNIFSPAMHKRKSFEHEKELRALVMGGDNLLGKLVPVNLESLIYKIYVAPNSQGWIHELVKKVAVKYSINKDVVNSGLEQNPLY